MSTISTPEAVVLSFAAQCDRGKERAENQDSVRQCNTPLGDLLIVADGIGGYEGGGVASRMAVEAISAALEGMPAFFPIDIAIEEAVCRANAEIVAAAAEPDTPNNRMGSTVVLALLQQDPGNARVQAAIGHIGDSRAYLLHHRRLTRVTRDHSAVQLLLDHDLIAPEQTRTHPDASVLTRTLGHEPNVKVDLNSIELEPGDTLLLCSDGLWGYVSDQEIERVLADPELTAEQASRSLLDMALDAGGQDNVGIQIARVTGTGIAATPRDAASGDEVQSDAEPAFPYLNLSRLRDPFAEPAAQPEIDLFAPPEAETIDSSSARIESLAIFLAPEAEIPPVSVFEPLSAPTAESEAAPSAGAGIESAPTFQLESPQSQRPESQLEESRVQENQIRESQVPESQVDVPQILEWKPEPVESEPVKSEHVESEPVESEPIKPELIKPELISPAPVEPEPIQAWKSELVPDPQVSEPRVTTILGTVTDLWETFVYPLGRDYDFAPEWHVDFGSAFETPGREKAERRPLHLPTVVAGILVTCAAAPKPELESLAEQESKLHARFKSSKSEVSMLLKSLGILLLAFCTSCGLVYCALFQNWFGIDQLLHLR